MLPCRIQIETCFVDAACLTIMTKIVVTSLVSLDKPPVASNKKTAECGPKVRNCHHRSCIRTSRQHSLSLVQSRYDAQCGLLYT